MGHGSLSPIRELGEHGPRCTAELLGSGAVCELSTGAQAVGHFRSRRSVGGRSHYVGAGIDTLLDSRDRPGDAGSRHAACAVKTGAAGSDSPSDPPMGSPPHTISGTDTSLPPLSPIHTGCHAAAGRNCDARWILRSASSTGEPSGHAALDILARARRV